MSATRHSLIPEQNITAKAASASKWSFLSDMAYRAVSPVTLIVLARLLTPEDFGIMAIATIVMNFVQLFSDCGFGRVIVQKECDAKDLDRICSASFWFSIVFGIVLFAGLFFLAGPLSGMFGEPRARAVIQVMAFQALIFAPTTIQNALLQRELNYKLLFKVRLITVFLPVLASIPLAYMGYGYWALVASSMVGSAANAAVLWKLTSWRPRWEFDLSLFLSILPSGLWMMTESIMGWLTAWSDSLIVGAYLDAYYLGMFRTSLSVVNALFGIALSALLPVFYSSLSRFQNDSAAFLGFFRNCHKIVCMVAFPIATGLFLFGDVIGAVVFGQKWQGIGWSIGMLAILGGFGFFFRLNGEANRAKGKANYNTLIMAINLCIHIPVYILAIARGYHVFVTARVLIGFVQVPYHFYVSRKLFSFSFRNALYNVRWPLYGVSAMALVCWYIRPGIPAGIAYQLALAFGCACLYALFLLPEKAVLLKAFNLGVGRCPTPVNEPLVPSSFTK